MIEVFGILDWLLVGLATCWLVDFFSQSRKNLLGVLFWWLKMFKFAYTVMINQFIYLNITQN